VADKFIDEKETLNFLNSEEKKHEKIIKKERSPYTYIILPGIIITILFMVPFIWGIYLSFTGYRLNNPNMSFNFFKNYIRLLPSARFWYTLLLSFEYTSIAVAIEMVFGYYIATLLNYETIMSKIMRRLIVIPFMVAPIIGTLLLKIMMNNKYGIINYFLSFFGLMDFPWGASPSTAMFTIIMVDVWIFTPFVVLILLSGKRGLSKDPFEAAAVDGAKGFNVFRILTIPMLMPTILIAFIFRVIDSIKVFDIIWGMTGGGPGDATTVFSAVAYVNTFLSLNVSAGTTILVIAWIIIFIISRWLVKFWDKARANLS
jgi:multiple sugar transport system permease protein